MNFIKVIRQDGQGAGDDQKSNVVTSRKLGFSCHKNSFLHLSRNYCQDEEKQASQNYTHHYGIRDFVIR